MSSFFCFFLFFVYVLAIGDSYLIAYDADVADLPDDKSITHILCESWDMDSWGADLKLVRCVVFVWKNVWKKMLNNITNDSRVLTLYCFFFFLFLFFFWRLQGGGKPWGAHAGAAVLGVGQRGAARSRRAGQAPAGISVMKKS